MISIRKKEMEFLSGELDLWQEEDLITSEQADKILSLYDIKKSNLRLILFIAGGILLGLGLVSFVAAHWRQLPKILRVALISGSYLASLTAYFFFGKSKTKSGHSFLLLSSMIFGTGIFLLPSLYGFSLDVEEMIMFWTAEALITTLISRDTWQIYLAQILSLIYLNVINAIDIFALEFANLSKIPLNEFFTPLTAFALIIALWSVWYFVKDRIAFNFNMLLTILLLASRMSLCFGGTLTLIILALSGALMSFISMNHDTEILGLLMTGLFSLLLTWPEFWRGEIFDGVKFLPILTAIFAALIMLVNIYRGHYATGIIFCALLASRYFFDHLFGYMPKALGFTLTGIIFMTAGLFFGRIKKFFEK